MEEETKPLLGEYYDYPTESALAALEVASAKHKGYDWEVDHGILAWSQVLGGFILYAHSWGLPTLFGIFQSFYVNHLLPDQDASSIAWIGSIQLFFTTIGCLPGGVLLDRGHLKTLIAVGTLLEVLGLVWTSCCTTFWAILFAQGVCMGIGSGLLGLVPIAVIGMYFEEKRMLATGIAATGASFAGIAYPIILRLLFTTVGFSQAVRILALIILFTNGLPFLLMRLQFQCHSKSSAFSLRHFRDLPYAAFVCAFTLFMASAFVPFFFIQEYALTLGVSADMAVNLLSIMNAANLLGRFMPNSIADRYGGINTLLPICLYCISILLILPFIRTITALVIASILYGFLSGGVLVIPTASFSDFTPNAAEMGVRMGLAYLVGAFGGLLGNPVAGAAKGTAEDSVQNFRNVWWCSAGIMTLGLLALMVARRLKTGTFFGAAKI